MRRYVSKIGRVMLLYRGVSLNMDASLNGELIPKGRKPEVTAYHDVKIKHDSTFTHGQTEDNAARAQHLDSGLYDNCFISTTRNEKMAVLFATRNFKEPGYVYVLDSLLFKRNYSPPIGIKLS